MSTTASANDHLTNWLHQQLENQRHHADALKALACTLPAEPRAYLTETADVLLAGVDADRRTLDLHEVYERKPSPYGAAGLQCAHCASLCHSSSGLHCELPYDAPWPCPDVRLLALRHASRPGYQPEWAPDTTSPTSTT